jgi:hypothetical protein
MMRSKARESMACSGRADAPVDIVRELSHNYGGAVGAGRFVDSVGEEVFVIDALGDAASMRFQCVRLRKVLQKNPVPRIFCTPSSIAAQRK